MIQLYRVLGDAPLACQGMTFATFGPHLRGLHLDSEFIAIALQTEDGTPLGLGLARSAEGGGKIVSLFIRPEWWNRGLGTAVLAALEEVLQTRGCREVRIAYSTGPASPALERVLEKRGWHSPEPRLLLAQMNPRSIKDRWVHEMQVPPPFEPFPWGDITPEEIAALAALRATIPPEFWPFEGDAPVEPVSSLGLRLGREIVGWLVTHRVAPQTVRFTTLYLRDPWRRTELSFALLAEAMRRHVRHLPPEILGSFAVQMSNVPMLRVAERRFRRYADYWAEQRTASKSLIAG